MKKKALHFNSFCWVCVQRIKIDVVHARCVSVSVKLTLNKRFVLWFTLSLLTLCEKGMETK